LVIQQIIISYTKWKY